MKGVLPLLILVAAPAVGAPAPPVPAVAPPTAADWRTPDPQNVLVIDTSKGRIIVEMAPLAAPLTVAQVRDLARAGFYDGLGFFRVIDNFMDQTGDPQNNGQGQSTKPNLPPEFTFKRGPEMPVAIVLKDAGAEAGFLGSLPVISQAMDLALFTADHKVKAYGVFCQGVAGMARAEAEDSGNSQFYLMRAATPSLDLKYTPWGRAILGLDVIRAIKVGEPVPAPQDTVVKVRVLADIPAAERPTVRVIDPGGPWFKAEVERVRKEKAVGVGVCDLDLPVDIH
jgi:peptidylprolyl isomerase